MLVFLTEQKNTSKVSCTLAAGAACAQRQHLASPPKAVTALITVTSGLRRFTDVAQTYNPPWGVTGAVGAALPRTNLPSLIYIKLYIALDPVFHARSPIPRLGLDGIVEADVRPRRGELPSDLSRTLFRRTER